MVGEVIQVLNTYVDGVSLKGIDGHLTADAFNFVQSHDPKFVFFLVSLLPQN